MTAMPRRKASSGERSVDGRAVEDDLPGVRPIEAAQKLDAGALAGAVLAEQRQHLAGAQLERNVPEATVPPKALVAFSSPSTGPRRTSGFSATEEARLSIDVDMRDFAQAIEPRSGRSASSPDAALAIVN